jgi:hypothetical protein
VVSTRGSRGLRGFAFGLAGGDAGAGACASSSIGSTSCGLSRRASSRLRASMLDRSSRPDGRGSR